MSYEYWEWEPITLEKWVFCFNEIEGRDFNFKTYFDI